MDNLSDSMYSYRHEFGLAREICYCEECKTTLTTNDEFYKIEEKIICEDCISSFKVCGEDYE